MRLLKFLLLIFFVTNFVNANFYVRFIIDYPVDEPARALNRIGYSDDTTAIYLTISNRFVNRLQGFVIDQDIEVITDFNNIKITHIILFDFKKCDNLWSQATEIPIKDNFIYIFKISKDPNEKSNCITNLINVQPYESKVAKK